MSVQNWNVTLSLVGNAAAADKPGEADCWLSEWQCDMQNFEWSRAELWHLAEGDSPTVRHLSTPDSRIVRMDLHEQGTMALWEVPLPPLVACSFGMLKPEADAALSVKKEPEAEETYTEQETKFAAKVRQLEQMQEDYEDEVADEMEELEEYVESTFDGMSLYENQRMQALLDGILVPPKAGTPECSSGHPCAPSTYNLGAYTSGWTCNECGRSKGASTERWFCEQCSDDFCYDCRAPLPSRVSEGPKLVPREPVPAVVICVSPLKSAGQDPAGLPLELTLTGEQHDGMWCGWNAVHMAVARDNKSLLNQIAATKSEETIFGMLSAQDRKGQTPFMVAMEYCHLAAGSLIIDWVVAHSEEGAAARVASLTALNIAGQTPLGVLLVSSAKLETVPELDAFVNALHAAPELVSCVGNSRQLMLIEHLQQSTTSMVALKLAADSMAVCATSNALIEHGGVEAAEALMCLLVASEYKEADYRTQLLSSLIEADASFWMDAAVRVFVWLFGMATLDSPADIELECKFKSLFAQHASSAIQSLGVAAATIVRPLFLGFPVAAVPKQHPQSPVRLAAELAASLPLCPMSSAISQKPHNTVRGVALCAKNFQPPKRAHLQRQTSRRLPKQTWYQEFAGEVIPKLKDIGRRTGMSKYEIDQKLEALRKMSDDHQRTESVKLTEEWTQKDKFQRWAADERQKADHEKMVKHAAMLKAADAIPEEVISKELPAAKESSLSLDELMTQPATYSARLYHLMVSAMNNLVDVAEVDAVETAVSELAESDQWLTLVMDELLDRMDQSVGVPGIAGRGPLSVLRCTTSGKQKNAPRRYPLPDELAHGYIAIILDAVVIWKGFVNQRLTAEGSPVRDKLRHHSLGGNSFTAAASG